MGARSEAEVGKPPIHREPWDPWLRSRENREMGIEGKLHQMESRTRETDRECPRGAGENGARGPYLYRPRFARSSSNTSASMPIAA